MVCGEQATEIQMKKKKGFRNWVAKNNKHKGGKHKSKKDYDRKSLVRKLKQFIKGL
tara:strand:- start:291 stop:458 length:168 start_codon:yes stop_codon:yes gene_type:complete